MKHYREFQFVSRVDSRIPVAKTRRPEIVITLY